MMNDARTPLTVLTGFLGAGKTTVLKKLLAHEQAGEVAVLINEFGEVGIDQQLVTALSPDVVLLDSGCICCQIRGELKDCLLDLLDRRARGELPPFKRVVMETTGLAEPTPILATLMTDPVLSHQFRVAGVWTVVDALHADGMAARQQPIWVQQLTAADQVLITKTDLLDAAQIDALLLSLAAWVPGVPLMPLGLMDDLPALNHQVALTEADLGRLVKAPAALRAIRPTLHDARESRESRESPQSAGSISGRSSLASAHQPFLPSAGGEGADGNGGAEGGGSLADKSGAPLSGDIQSIAIEVDAPVDWTAFGVWLSALLHVHGRAVLRVKGILNIGEKLPVLINGVQHMIHPPEHLPSWGGQQPRTQLVVISQGLDTARIEASFRRWVLDQRASGSSCN
ncbi:MAG: GTP-binding protein [Lautropia sp.]|nr:GTP-binding protein [Lautropia sp.]